MSDIEEGDRDETSEAKLAAWLIENIPVTKCFVSLGVEL